MSNNLIFYDTETTGLDTDTARIVEIGAATLSDNKVHRFRSLVNPGVDIPKECSDIHGIDNNMVKDAESASSILPRFFEKMQHIPHENLVSEDQGVRKWSQNDPQNASKSLKFR